MRTRLFFTLLALCIFLIVGASPAGAAPAAHLLRIDPLASQTEGAPLLTTVIELVQNKKVNEAIQECAALKGDTQLDCQSEKLEAPQALYSPIAFPKEQAVFTVVVDNADRLATIASNARWGESLGQPGVGTAWLILIDASGSMGSRFEDAKTVASTFVRSMTTNDIVDVMFFNDRQVVSDSKWQPSAAKTQVDGFVNALKSTYPAQGRVRPLLNIIKDAATAGFGELGNVGAKVPVPLHQAMLVLSNGVAGTDPLTNAGGALQLNTYLTKGRFPEDNTVLPKTPLPVISIWLPSKGYDEVKENAQQFMQGLANPDIGGFYDVIRAGQGAAKAPKLLTTVRTRFNQMHIVKWRVSCIAPTVTQTFKLVFTNTQTPIAGDSTFKDVPMGIDPTAWPLDINVTYTQDRAKSEPIQPGGKFTVFGNFCWGGEKDRAEAYFLAKNTALPAAIAGTDIEAAKRTQQQLIASGMRGKAIQSSDGDVVFEAPDKDTIGWGSGTAMVARLIIYDNKAHRASGVTATTVLTLHAAEKQLPWLYIIGGAFGLVVLALLAIVLLRGGVRPAAARPAPVVAGGYVPQAPVPSPAPVTPQYGGYSPAAPPVGYPPVGYPPVGPPAAAAASRATLSGSAGVYTVMPGFEMRVGRDAAQCQIVFTEARVSSAHATLKMEAGQLYVRDDQSNNGTFVNGNRLAPGVWTLVASGSVVKFGPVDLSVQLD